MLTRKYKQFYNSDEKTFTQFAFWYHKDPKVMQRLCNLVESQIVGGEHWVVALMTENECPVPVKDHWCVGLCFKVEGEYNLELMKGLFELFLVATHAIEKCFYSREITEELFDLCESST